MMLQNGIRLMQYCAIGLGLETNYFDKFFEKDTLSTFRFLHY